ncbi:MAG: vitamin K epoxide reductase family protein [marine benthic group bacterium]|nr:vitamin K epoxide reductase family protein [Gemmatimonadota bacterium]MCL7938343.1 vitamin K epoxide reductase family protein [Gemmatimonadota bacterium]MCL7964161.1 vitamin K epoxide reductase family protein [Gemmatimonadota bacterium]MCL7968604.1 vitamin K epoxide reductase family protein [Gemmatimonadota bacterium]MCL7974752.1 vitamin K epoxide reductase family protein [Gemmatimonadota bacterium]
MNPVARYRGVALLALVGLFISLYLLLYHLGFYGVLACGSGSCDVVQASRYADFLGIPVPAWGVAWYGAVVALSLVQQARGDAEGLLARLLDLAALGGLAFSIYLTAIELFVLHAVCRWCVVSAVLAVGIFLLVAPWTGIRAASRRSSIA